MFDVVVMGCHRWQNQANRCPTLNSNARPSPSPCPCPLLHLRTIKRKLMEEKILAGAKEMKGVKGGELLEKVKAIIGGAQ